MTLESTRGQIEFRDNCKKLRHLKFENSMGLFKSSDDRMIERFEKEEMEMLLKYYNLRKTDKECPTNAYLLNPDRLHLSSYEVKTQSIVKLNVGYKRNYSGYVTETVRANYNQVILGTIYCEGVESYTETTFNRTGTIKIPFLSKTKIINLPIQNTHNIEVKCQTLRVESIDIYVESEGKLVRDQEYRIQLGEQLKNSK